MFVAPFLFVDFVKQLSALRTVRCTRYSFSFVGLFANVSQEPWNMYLSASPNVTQNFVGQPKSEAVRLRGAKSICFFFCEKNLFLRESNAMHGLIFFREKTATAEEELLQLGHY